MRYIAFLFGLLTVCSIGSSKVRAAASQIKPEHMLITYHVRSDVETEFEEKLKNLWKLYREKKMIVAPPTCLKIADEHGFRYVTIVHWVSFFATEHFPPEVEAIHQSLENLCEARNGGRPIEVRRGTVLIP